MQARDNTQARDERADPALALNPPVMVKAAAAFQAVSGIYLAASAFQMLMSITFYGELSWVQYANWMLALCGVLQVFFAAQTIRLRPTYVFAAVPFNIVLALVVAAWIGVNVHFMIFSVMQLGTLCFSWAAAILMPFVIGPTRRASEARRALEAEGLDLGV